jgi:PTS system nitrogen regulatory IIA component
VVDKLERQINHQHSMANAKKKGSESAGAFAAAAARGEDDLPKARVATRPRETSVKLVEIVTEDRVALVGDGASLDKHESLARLAELLSSAIGSTPQRVLSVLEEREAVQTTGIGDGVAMPHGTIDSAKGQVGALLVCPGGVDFEAIDGRPAKILFGVVGPRQAVEHLKVLARISRLLRSESFRQRLLEADGPKAVYSLLRSEDDQLG